MQNADLVVLPTTKNNFFSELRIAGTLLRPEKPVSWCYVSYLVAFSQLYLINLLIFIYRRGHHLVVFLFYFSVTYACLFLCSLSKEVVINWLFSVNLINMLILINLKISPGCWGTGLLQSWMTWRCPGTRSGTACSQPGLAPRSRVCTLLRWKQKLAKFYQEKKEEKKIAKTLLPLGP